MRSTYPTSPDRPAAWPRRGLPCRIAARVLPRHPGGRAGKQPAAPFTQTAMKHGEKDTHSERRCGGPLAAENRGHSAGGRIDWRIRAERPASARRSRDADSREKAGDSSARAGRRDRRVPRGAGQERQTGLDRPRGRGHGRTADRGARTVSARACSAGRARSRRASQAARRPRHGDRAVLTVHVAGSELR